MPKNIGNLIEGAMKKGGYTQSQLARELGVVPATVNNWIRRNTLPEARIAELERVLGPLLSQQNAQWLREERDEAGLTQKELADKANVSVLTISNIERGETNPQKGTIAKLERALGKSAPNDGEGDHTEGVIDAPDDGDNDHAEIVSDMEDFLPHDRDDRRRLLNGVKGVYVLMDRNRNAVYVGKSDRNIRERIEDHSTRRWYNEDTITSAKYIKCDDVRTCDKIESILIQLLHPQINRQQN